MAVNMSLKVTKQSAYNKILKNLILILYHAIPQR